MAAELLELQRVTRSLACTAKHHVDCFDEKVCACPCHSDSLPIKGEPEEVKKVGLGYQAYYPADGVEITLERIRESRGEIHGELFVRLRDEAVHFAEGHLFGGNFNASSLTARNTVSKYLNSRTARDWAAIFERFCLGVLRGERRGSDFERVGQDPSREGPAYFMDPILPLNQPTLLYGAGGSGKSTVAGAIAVSVETKTEIVPGWKPTPGRVLILDWEHDKAAWNDRIRAIAHGRGLSAPSIHYRRMTRPLSDGLEQIAKFVDEQCILLVVVDSVEAAIGTGGEGESWKDGALRLFAAARELRTTILLIDHVAGSDLHSKESTAKPYGSVYKMNFARNAFELRRAQDHENGKTEILLNHKKFNDGPTRRPQGLAITYQDACIRFDPISVQAPELVRTLSLPARMERLLLERGALTTSLIAQELETTESTIRSIVSRDKTGRLVRLPDGRIGRGEK